ncbi:hypothetical protein C0Q70_13386 [Pomacea canaliculata]|uniref:Uncharacterized protein n=1 Tax=Pomacea canaliculata TaxID=400727 RepID=A0A2T7NX30_POMCA|nr:hypothetical protein C0Q70_13386 [Pomacea canaliculata]
MHPDEARGSSISRRVLHSHSSATLLPRHLGTASVNTWSVRRDGGDPRRPSTGFTKCDDNSTSASCQHPGDHSPGAVLVLLPFENWDTTPACWVCESRHVSCRWRYLE